MSDKYFLFQIKQVKTDMVIKLSVNKKNNSGQYNLFGAKLTWLKKNTLEIIRIWVWLIHIIRLFGLTQYK